MDNLEDQLAIQASAEIARLLKGKPAEVSADALAIACATLISAYPKDERTRLLMELTKRIANYVPAISMARDHKPKVN